MWTSTSRMRSSRLKQEGIVTELDDGTLQTLPPQEAARSIDKLWDPRLDQIPDMIAEEGREIAEQPAG